MDLRNCTKQELSQMPYEYVREAYYQHNPNAVWILGVFFVTEKWCTSKLWESKTAPWNSLRIWRCRIGIYFGNIYEEGLGTTVDLKKQKIIIVHFLKKRMINRILSRSFLYLKNENLPNRDEKFRSI